MKEKNTRASTLARWATRCVSATAVVLIGLGKFGMDNPDIGGELSFVFFAVGWVVAIAAMVLMAANMGFAVKRSVATWLTIAAGCMMVIGLCGLAIEPGLWPVVIAAAGAGLFVLGLLWVKRCPIFAEGDNVEQTHPEATSKTAPGAASEASDA